MSDLPASSSAQPSALDVLVFTLTVRAVSSSSGIAPRPLASSFCYLHSSKSRSRPVLAGLRNSVGACFYGVPHVL